MLSPDHSEALAAAANPFTSADVLAILRERGWLATEPTPGQAAWCEHAAAILGGHAADRDALAELLSLVFHYDARRIISKVDSHIVLSRYAAREVLRQLALLLLDGAPLTSERFGEIIAKLKEDKELRGRELFHPIRPSAPASSNFARHWTSPAYMGAQLYSQRQRRNARPLRRSSNRVSARIWHGFRM